jgi:hypothetical protein
MAKKASSTNNVKGLSNADLGKILDEQAPLIESLTTQLAAAELRLQDAKDEIARRSGATSVPAPATRKGPKPKVENKAGKPASERKRGVRNSGFPGPNSVKGRILATVTDIDMSKADLLKKVNPDKPEQFGVPLSQLVSAKLLAMGKERATYKRGPKYGEYAASLKAQN